MSVSGISSSSFIQQSIASQQSQAQRAQEFQSLAKEFQSGSLSSAQAAGQTTQAAQTTALQELGAPTSAAPSGSSGVPTDSTSGQAPVQSNHLHWHHRLRLPLENGADNNSGAAPSLFGQVVQSGNASSAQQAYRSLQHDLQQVALNGDLINAQSAALQSADLSVTA